MLFNHPITEAEVMTVINDCKSQLNYNILLPTLGCGDFGCSFKLSNGNVLKLTKHEKEYTAAQLLLAHQPIHPLLPIIKDTWQWTNCHSFSMPVYGVEREDLDDLQVEDIDWYSEILSEFEYALYDDWNQRTLTVDQMIDYMTELLTNNPGATEDEIRIEQVLDLYVALFDDAWLDDIVYSNWGQRKNAPGVPVLRDLGAMRLRSV